MKTIIDIKRENQYSKISSTFYLNMFKALENENYKIIFYIRDSGRLNTFWGIMKEDYFEKCFIDKITHIRQTKTNSQIILENGSKVDFIVATDNARGYRYHHAVVDTSISLEMYDHVIRTKSTHYDRDRILAVVSDVEHIDFLDFGDLI